MLAHHMQDIQDALNSKDLVKSVEAFKSFGLYLMQTYPDADVDINKTLEKLKHAGEAKNIGVNLRNFVIFSEAVDTFSVSLLESNEEFDADEIQVLRLAHIVFRKLIDKEETENEIAKIEQEERDKDGYKRELELLRRMFEAQAISIDALQKIKMDKEDLGLEVDKALADLQNSKRKPSPEQKILENEIAKLSHVEGKINHYVENELDAKTKQEFQVDAHIVKTITEALQKETARYFNLANPKEKDLQRLKEKWDKALDVLNKTYYVKNHPSEEKIRENRVKAALRALIRKFLKRIGIKSELFSKQLNDARKIMIKVEVKQRKKLK